jgi:hypothetical protein
MSVLTIFFAKAFSLEASGRWLFLSDFQVLGAGVWRKAAWRTQRTIFFFFSLSF